jgi:hypothetical protein
VELKDSTIEVSIDVDRINADKGKFDKLVKYAESGKLDKVIELAGELIENATNISEYHRVRGQAYSEKRDIFYNNTARFLELTPEQIQKHYERAR